MLGRRAAVTEYVHVIRRTWILTRRTPPGGPGQLVVRVAARREASRKVPARRAGRSEPRLLRLRRPDNELSGPPGGWAGRAIPEWKLRHDAPVGRAFSVGWAPPTIFETPKARPTGARALTPAIFPPGRLTRPWTPRRSGRRPARPGPAIGCPRAGRSRRGRRSAAPAPRGARSPTRAGRSPARPGGRRRGTRRRRRGRPGATMRGTAQRAGLQSRRSGQCDRPGPPRCCRRAGRAADRGGERGEDDGRHGERQQGDPERDARSSFGMAPFRLVALGSRNPGESASYREVYRLRGERRAGSGPCDVTGASPAESDRDAE